MAPKYRKILNTTYFYDASITLMPQIEKNSTIIQQKIFRPSLLINTKIFLIVMFIIARSDWEQSKSFLKGEWLNWD